MQAEEDIGNTINVKIDQIIMFYGQGKSAFRKKFIFVYSSMISMTVQLIIMVKPNVFSVNNFIGS